MSPAASILHDSYNEEINTGINVHAGQPAHLQIGDFFAIRPSLLVQTGKFETPDDDLTISLMRISISVAQLFSKNFGNNNKMYFGAGPSVKFALAGKSNNNVAYEMRKIKFGNSTEDDEII